MLCSCRLWPSPGMYAVISRWLLRRTRAILRSAEFGFFGVVVRTCRHTPRLNWLLSSAGHLLFLVTSLRFLRDNWFSVGIGPSGVSCGHPWGEEFTFPLRVARARPSVFRSTPAIQPAQLPAAIRLSPGPAAPLPARACCPCASLPAQRNIGPAA